MSLVGVDVDWIRKTSSPRTFSRISTKISESEKRRICVRVSAVPSAAEIASASGRLLFPATSFIDDGSLERVRQDEAGRAAPQAPTARGLYQSDPAL